MGIVGSDVSKDAADVILIDDNFASIVNGIKEGRLVFDNLKKSIAFTLTSKFPQTVPFLLFIILQIPLPINTLLLFCIDLIADLLPAVSLAFDPPVKDIMKRGPRDIKRQRLINLNLLFFAYIQCGIIQVICGFTNYFLSLALDGLALGSIFFLNERAFLSSDDQTIGGTTYSSSERNDILGRAQTAYFISILMMQSALLLSIRTRKDSLWTMIKSGKFFTNYVSLLIFVSIFLLTLNKNAVVDILILFHLRGLDHIDLYSPASWHSGNPLSILASVARADSLHDLFDFL